MPKLQPWAVVRALRQRLSAAVHAARSKPPDRPNVGGELASLDRLDDEFHAAYERVRDEAATDDPVFVVLANDLVFFHGGERRAWSFSPRAYHVLKEVAHVPLALFSSLGSEKEEPAEHAMGRSGALLEWIEAAKRKLSSVELGEHARRDSGEVLERSASTLRSESLTHASLLALAKDTGPLLKRLIERATELQLDALHEHVESALHSLSRDQVARVQVVVTGNHQARTRSMPMQYFLKRLNEPEGEERRVSYAEAVSNEQEALALIGTKTLDRAIAAAFFGDPTRMQRDLLGDAAHAILAKRDLTPIG